MVVIGGERCDETPDFSQIRRGTSGADLFGEGSWGGGGIFPGLTWSNSLRMWLTALNGTSIESIESTHQYIVMSHESSHRAVLGSFSFGTGPRV